MTKIYVQSPPDTAKAETPAYNLSIDVSLQDCLININRVLEKVSGLTTKSGLPDREVISALEKCVNMLLALKKQEKDILDKMSPEDLEKAIKEKYATSKWG